VADDALDAALIQFKQEQDDRTTLGATASIHQAITQNPDEMARYNAISRKTGFDPLLIATDPAVKVEAERRAKMQDIDLPGLVQTHPKTASALTDANLAALVSDDVGTLQNLENAFSRGLKGTLRGGDAGAIQESAEILNTISRIQSGELNDYGKISGASRYASLFAGVGGTPEAVEQKRIATERRLAENAVEFAQRTAGMKSTGASAEYERFSAEKGLGAFSALFDAPFKITGEVIAESMGAMLPAIPTIVGSGVGGGVRGLATATGLTSAGIEYANSLSGILTDMGVNLSDARAVREAMATPKFIEANRQAMVKAGVIGAFDAATAGVAGKMLRPTMLGNIAAQTVVQAAGGAAGEAVGSVASGQEVSLSAVLAEAIGEAPGGVVDVGLLAFNKARVKEQARPSEEIIRAEEAHAALTEISQTATSAKLRERDPAQFKAFMQSMVEDSDLKEVFVDGTVLRDALAQAPIEVQQKFAQDMPEVVRQIGEAAGTDGLVRVPVEDYATHVAGTELDATILPNLKTEVDGLTYSQAQEQVKGQTEQMKAEADQLLAEKEKDTEFQADAQQVYDALYSRIEGAKRFTPDANKKYAALQQAYFITRAHKMGIKPSELLARFDIRVTAERTPGAELEQGVTLLEGLPQPKMTLKTGAYTPKPYAPAHKAAREYANKAGIEYAPPRKYAKVNEARAAKIAAEYEKMPHAPNDPEVAKAYAQLIKEAVQQWDAMLSTGLKVEFIPEGAPDFYAENPHGFIDDIARNNHLWVFSTRAGFGTGQDFTPKDHPLLAETDIEISGQKALANDIFRAVHDFFGHAKDGVGFRAAGEENAWRAHAAMFSPLARRALTTETRGQNSWLNYGPFGEANRKAKAGETHFADQKAGLLPEWVSEEGREDVAPVPTPASSDYGFRRRAKARVATLDDFKPNKVKNLLAKTDWAILTAENPNAQQLSVEENAQRNADLRADLEAMGAKFVEVEGKYGGNVENSVAITGITREQANELGIKYGQQSVLTRDGLVYPDGTVNPAKSVTVHAKAPSDFYSTIPSTGATFAVEIDFGKTLPTSDERVGSVTVEAVHFSRAPRSSLSGRMYGTGIKGAEARRLGDPNAHPKIKQRVSFYVDEGQGVRPEPGVGAFRHGLTLDNIYDGAKNPLGFPTESNAFEAAVVEAGFDGYYIREGFGNQGVGVLLGDATQDVEVDIPPRPTKYAQALNEVAETLPPAGKLEQQDLADLRKLWAMYAASETAAQYGTAQVKAQADDAPGIQRALSDTLDAVMQGMVDTSVKNITHWHKGTQRLPAGGFAYEIVSGNSSAAVYLDMADRSMQIDITRWGEGRGGSGVYKALLDFAQANGFVFYGDAQGISVAGIKRRLENLLSHALQSGDTSYMRLHPKQIDFIEQETGLKVNWTDDSKNNVEQMLNASYNLANLDIPELKNVYFDFTQREFIARNTGAPADLAGLVAKARRNPDQVRREGAPGLASAKRTVFANTLLSAKGETRRTVFAEMARLSLEQLPGAERLLYQSEPPGERPPFYSALTRAFEETKLAKASPDQWLGTLKSLTQKGVKPMEIEYTGLQERLEVRKDKADSWHVYENGVVVSTRPATDPKPEGADVRLYQPSKVVTKEEIIDFLKENAVTVEPRVYGGEGVVTEFDFTFGQWETEEPDENWLRDQAQDRVRGMGEDELSSGLEGIADEDEDGSIDTAIEAVRGYINESGPGQSAQKTEGTRGYKLFEKLVEGAFEQERENYWDDGDSPQNSSVEVEAGGRTFNFTWTNSYHEHFLYAHESNKSVEISGRSIDSADIESAIREFLGTEYGISEVDDEKAPKFESYKLSGGENYRERLLLNKSHKGETFSYTNHFDDDNIIGHSRVDDREVPVEAIEKEFPELAARMKAEGRTTAKVYFIEEVQSDWAQQGRERPEAQKHYAMEDLVFNEKASARNDDRLARIKVSAISDRSGYTHTRDRGLVKDQVEFWHLHTEEDLSAYPSEIYTTKEAAERGRFAVAGAVWVIEAPNQVFEILRAQHPTVEEAKRYIADVKTTMVPGEMTAFELARKQGALQRKLDALRKEARALAQGPEDDATNAEYQSAQDRIAEVRGQLEEIGNKVVTPGAFVESTDAWVGLVVKDAVHQAAKGGFDLISWTTGDQQTQRWSYGLRKQVDLIEWTKSEEGKIHIVAMQRGVTKADTKYGENDLSAAIGKTMAKRIIEDPNQNGFIEGEGITVADLGMTKFYGDTAGLDPSGKPAILTKVANQVAKKLGGGQVVAAKLNPAFGRMSDREKGSALNVQPTFEVTLPMRVAALQGQVLFQSFTVDAEQVKKLQEKLDTSKVDAEEYYKRGYRIDDFGSMDRTGEDLSASDMFQKNRGTFNPDTLTISLLKDADLTTFLHETGHFFLEMEAALASDPRATPEMRDDFTKVLNWFGVKDLTEWNALSFEQKRSHHEKFARGFEAYLFEGKAPSNDLRSIFASFKTWLLHVYRSITNLNVELTDEVRGVFDRMLASEEAIATVQRRTGLTDAMIEAANSKDKAAYLALNLAAGDNAGDDLQRRSLRDMKWLSNAKSQELKKLQREAASKRKEVRAEVTAEVNAEPINQARAFLRKGTTTGPDGESIQATEGFRLNHAIVAEMYPETMLARPDLSKLRGMTEADGLHPDLVADMFGFRSGDALIRELIDGENPRDKINGMTDQRMMERYGDLNDERAIENAANSAVHNEARARFMATGLKMLSDSKLPASQIQKAATDAANQAIAAKKVRDLHPAKHIAAETKANKDVLKNAAKDVKAAQRAQRSALLNNRLAKASQDAQEEVRKGVDRMTRTQKAAAQKNMRGEYLIQLNELLARFDLRKSTTLKEIDAKRTPLAEWLAAESERMSAVMPDIPAWILNEANRTSYKDLTVEEFRGVVDTVKQLEMMARREETQYQAIRGMKFAEERKALLDRIREFHPEAFDLNGEPLGMAPKFVKHLGDKVEELGEKFAGEFLNAETLVNLLEGGEFGIAHESLLGRMSKRADWKATRLEGIYNKMAPLFGQYSVKERYDFARKDIGAPIGMSLTRENALVVALLHGNTEGRERLANYGWSEKKQEEIINLLDDRDMALAQGIWDLFDNDLWPELKDLNDRTRGKAPPKVVAIQVFHRGGTYRGGYFRLKYDTNLDERAYRMDEGAAVKELLGGGLGMSAKTGQGASTERKQNVTMRPRLDLGVFAEAVSETVHDIAYREAVADTMRMLNDTRVQNTIKTAAGVPAYRALVTRVREIAAPPRNPSGFVEKTLSIARKNTIVTLMSGVNTALQNFTGFVSATARVNPGRLAKEIALFYSTKMTERVNFAMEHSEYMRHRHNAFERDLQNEIKKMTVNASIMPDTGAWLTLMALVDKGTSVPVWNAAFHEGMVKYENDNGKAADYADHVVRQSQGSGRELDVAQIMSGHGGYGQLKRVFTMFYSYFNAQLGMLVRSGVINAHASKKNPAMAVARFTKDFMVIVILPAVLTAMIFKKDDPDEDPEKWLHKYSHAIAMYGLAMIPLVRDVGSFAWASFDHDVKNYGYKITPVQSAGEGVVKGAVAARDIAVGEGDDRDLKNLIMGTSFAVGLPGKLISDITLGTKAFLEGEAGPEAILFGPPKK
jgi:hypothetical protein